MSTYGAGTYGSAGGTYGDLLGVTTHERSAALAATGAISSAGIKVVARSAAISATAAVVAVGQRRLQRSAAIASTAAIASAGQRRLHRSAAISSAAAITSSGTVEGAPETISRSASLTAVGSIAAIGDVFLHNRSASLSASATISARGHRLVSAAPFLVREPDVLSASVDIAGGNALRFGPDRGDEGELPLSIDWATQNPGGFADGSVVLSRPPWISAADAPLFGGFEIRGRGGDLKWAGRVKGVPQVDATTIRIEGEGLAAALSDDEFYREVYAHNDLSAWTGPAAERQLNLVNSGILPLSDGGPTNDPGTPSIATQITLPIDALTNADQYSEQWLRVDGIPLGTILGSWQTNDVIFLGDPTWEWEANFSLDGLFEDTGTGNLNVGAGPIGASGTFTHTNPDFDIPADWVFIVFKGVGIFSEVLGELAAVYWVPTVLGTHGLTPHELDDGRWGLIDSEIIAHAVENGTPSIPVDSTAIVSDDFIVPHFVQSGTVQSLIEEISVYGSAGGRLNDWGVYESFFWRPPGWGKTWRVRHDEVAMPSEAGPVTDNRCTGMVVTYSDGAGRPSSRFAVRLSCE